MKDSEIEHQHLSGTEAIEKVRGLLTHFRSAMMVTRGIDGEPHSRPMGLQGKPEEFNGVLWFFADDRSRTVSEISTRSKVDLILQCDKESAYVQLVGSGRVMKDRAKMEELYTPLLKTWFTEGLDDPHIVLIRFEAERGNFWDSPGGKLQVLAALAKSLVTGTPGQGGEVGDLRL